MLPWEHFNFASKANKKIKDFLRVRASLKSAQSETNQEFAQPEKIPLKSRPQSWPALPNNLVLKCDGISSSGNQLPD